MTPSGPPGAAPVGLREAATVILVRDGAPRADPAESLVEVLLLARHGGAVFAAGASVFPGGAVDLADRAPEALAACAGPSDAEASARLGLAGGGLALWVAGVRECFEEAGVLLARRRGTASFVDLGDPEVAGRFAGYRRALHRGELDMPGLCRAEDLELATDVMHYFSHWVTPEGVARRYDTRFFVAPAPPAQVAAHDDAETTGSLWLRPADALALRDRGEIHLVLPTVKNLEAVGRHRRTAELLAEAAATTEVQTVRPRIVPGESGVRILLEGEAGYEEAGHG